MSYTPTATISNLTMSGMDDIVLYHVWPTGPIAEIFEFGSLAPNESAIPVTVNSGPGGTDYWTLIFRTDAGLQTMPPTVAQVRDAADGTTLVFNVEEDDEVAIVNTGGNDTYGSIMPLATAGFLSQGDVVVAAAPAVPVKAASLQARA